MNLFDDWSAVGRVALATPLVYFAVIAFVRLSGKRTTSQMNNFDWIVTVAMGSMVGTTILSKNTAIANGILGIGLLVLLQWIVTWIAWRTEWFAKLIRSDPTLLMFRGEFLEPAMRRERVSRGELLAAIRETGLHSTDRVAAVVLETDANLSVLSVQDDGQDAPATVSAAAGVRLEPNDRPPESTPAGSKQGRRRP